MVEFALVIPIFLLVLVSLFDLGRAVFAYNTLTNAAREGARMAIVNQDSDDHRARAKAQTAIVELNDPSVDVDFYQMATNGTPDTSPPMQPRGRRAAWPSCHSRPPITRSPPSSANIVFGSGVTFSATSVLSVEYRCPNETFLTGAQCPKQP